MNTINGRTPEEIKKGLEHCAETDLAKKLNACKQGLKYWYAEDVAADALAYIQQLESAQPKWISVEEKLPEYDVKVLVAIPRYYGCDIRTARLYKSGAWLIGDMSAVGSTPTHWRPLPEPPKEEK